MVNAIYADGLQCLGRLCRAAGSPPAEAAEFEARARRVVAALEDKCWDERAGAFWDLYGSEERRARTLTFSSLFPLALESLDRAIARRHPRVLQPLHRPRPGRPRFRLDHPGAGPHPR